MELKRIGALSCAKIAGVLYAAAGLIIGFFFSLAAVFGPALGATSGDEPGAALFGVLFGIGASLVNATARITGRIQLELES